MRIRSSEIIPKALYLRRRELLALGAAGAGALLLPRHARAAETPHGRKLTVRRRYKACAGKRA